MLIWVSIWFVSIWCVNLGVNLVHVGCQFYHYLFIVRVNLVCVECQVGLYGVSIYYSWCGVLIWLLWVLCGVSIWLLLVMVCVAVRVNLVC